MQKLEEKVEDEGLRRKNCNFFLFCAKFDVLMSSSISFGPLSKVSSCGSISNTSFDKCKIWV